ncbi:hypothetical protein ANCDUO_15402 [Ancylostoma duodenale]|uniref:Uncharacterized protein n=1 Tax=Ancylostoma duodenale TaxID=51022 RepID=A0A0C2CX77_9BILA|nr:hypothetical protein ANCDUO_15402 [Ancylostoma duodenale]
MYRIRQFTRDRQSMPPSVEVFQHSAVILAFHSRLSLDLSHPANLCCVVSMVNDRHMFNASRDKLVPQRSDADGYK